jgi:hypothetical protein
MAVPTTLTISYISGYTNGIASAQATTSYTIPTTGANAPIDATQAVRNIQAAGGVWITNASGVKQFIPWPEIFSITAQ